MRTISIDGLKMPVNKLIEAGWKAPEEKKSLLWKPNIGETFYTISSLGVVCSAVWKNDRANNQLYRLGNCYRTQKEARNVVKSTRAIVRINRRIEELNAGWVPDWNDKDQRKWRVQLNQPDRAFIVNWSAFLKNRSEIEPIARLDIAHRIIEEMYEDLCTIFCEKK